MMDGRFQVHGTTDDDCEDLFIVVDTWNGDDEVEAFRTITQAMEDAERRNAE